MTAPQPKRPHGRRRRGRQSKRGDLWRPVPELAAPQPVTPVSDPAALLRSLGDVPLQGQGAVAEHYLVAVVERASGLAKALAATADLLVEPERDV